MSGFPRFLVTLLVVVPLLAAAASGIGYTWYTVEQNTELQQRDAIARTNTFVNGLAINYAEQIGRHITALDQTLEVLVKEQEADPRRFNLEAARARSRVLTGISRDMFLADENGVIRQASVPDFLGQSASNLDAFRDAAEHANDPPKLFLGGASVNPIMRQWHLDAARTLHHPDGSFAGIIDADYRLSSINEVFTAASPPGNGFAALVSLADGKSRLAFGNAPSTPDANISDTPMFAALDAAETGIWVGPSSTDSVTRVHAFRRIPGRDLAVIAGIDRAEALRPVTIAQQQARAYAAAITGLVLALTGFLLAALRARRRRAVIAREKQAQLAAAQALAEVSRAQSDVVARRLHATLGTVMDGLAIFDPHLTLVEWNALFPERAGINASLVRAGLSMEEVLRKQAEAGYFGAVDDVDGEIDRRATLLRAGNFGASQSFYAGGRTIELRCRPLPEGGFVALYTDVTEMRQARQLSREARETLARERTAYLRFLGVVAFEIRARVSMLARSVARLRAAPATAQPRTIDGIQSVGDSLIALANDTAEMPLLESGTVELRPALVSVRSVLRDVVTAVQPAAQDRGITVYLVVNETAPAELIADLDRMRQIVTLLLSEAVRSAGPDTVWLLADRGNDEPGEPPALRLTFRCFGLPVADGKGADLFPSLDTIAAPDPSLDTAGTGLGPGIARHLTTLMGGDVRCEGWSTLDGRTGNDFILTLPRDLLLGRRGRAPGAATTDARPLPRTRVLMIGSPSGLRMAAVTMLRRDGHMVESAETADEAARLLEVSPYDIVFMDTEIPGTRVESAVEQLRDASALARTMPIILLARPHEEHEARLWRDAGATDILELNPTLDELVAAIGRGVWQSRAFGPGFGFMPGLEEESEEGVPILAAERIAELQTNIPTEELIEMVEECIADLFHRLPALRRSLAAGSPGAITAQAHAMVGMAGGYGMAVLEARLRAILTAVRGRRLDTIDGAATVVENDLTRAAAALRRALRIRQPAATTAQS